MVNAADFGAGHSYSDKSINESKASKARLDRLVPAWLARVARGDADPRHPTQSASYKNELGGFVPGKYRAKPSSRFSGQNPGNLKKYHPIR